jgi:hypothetical protein
MNSTAAHCCRRGILINHLIRQYLKGTKYHESLFQMSKHGDFHNFDLCGTTPIYIRHIAAVLAVAGCQPGFSNVSVHMEQPGSWDCSQYNTCICP